MGDKYNAGNASVEMDSDMSEFFMQTLKKALPNAEKIMRESIESIETQAREEWTKRQPRRSFDKATGRWTTKDKSQKSYLKFKRGVRIEADGSIVVFLKNTAQYAWAIKFGADSKNKNGDPILQPQGKRVAQELLIKPLNKSAQKIVKALADDLTRK